MSSIVGTSYSELTLVTDPGRKPGFLDLSGFGNYRENNFCYIFRNPENYEPLDKKKV